MKKNIILVLSLLLMFSSCKKKTNIEKVAQIYNWAQNISIDSEKVYKYIENESCTLMFKNSIEFSIHLTNVSNESKNQFILEWATSPSKLYLYLDKDKNGIVDFVELIDSTDSTMLLDENSSKEDRDLHQRYYQDHLDAIISKIEK